MSFATQSARRHFAGRNTLHPLERRMKIPWFHSFAWTQRKEAIKARLAHRHERTMLRKLERQDIENGMSPEQAHLRTVERQEKLHPTSLVSKVLGKIGL